MSVVCKVCFDTHMMDLGEERGTGMCTHCPIPCQKCRAGGNGPYCASTPCSCACHPKPAHGSGPDPSPSPRSLAKKIPLKGGGFLEITYSRHRTSVSTLGKKDGKTYYISIDDSAKASEQLVGLFYQLVQLADIAALQEGGIAPMVSPAWLQERVPGLVALALGLGLLDPELGITPERFEEELK